MDAKEVNESKYKLNSIYLLFINHNFYATVYKQDFELLLIYDSMSTVELV